MSAAPVRVPDQAFQQLYRDLYQEKSRMVALGISAALPGGGQFYNDQPVKGSIVAVVMAGLLGSALTFDLLGGAAEDDYNENTRDTVDRRQDAMDHYKLRNVMLYSALAVYVLQLVDVAAYTPEAPTLQTRFESMGDAGFLFRF